ncbi:SDR family oxidoreductase [Rhizobium sp. ARZ01]|uniref:SDR family NAD(P)-dependent oxidoreductase n=1 Tax=Rhizobium sp. ARZ01 TaxID=2769313 RepID=UPI001786AAB9|nr:SDR family NAD(P)-dependent oxidoreductase [Rhizobium sp. ARZ01]MBD9375717.1 SDR family oxidoreductase [Rhizobium sp. ARZ01]
MKGRSAIVTGAGRGLGLVIAQRLLERGARVAIWDVDGEAAREAAEQLSDIGSTHACGVDVTSPSEVAAALASTRKMLGEISILVCNAAVPGPNKPVWKIDAQEWERVMTVNVTGALLCCQAVIPEMIARGYGRIVNIASVAGKEPGPQIAAYAASKAALISLTKTMGRELATTGITANCVAPGAIRTRIFDDWPEAYVQELLGKIPMDRFGTAEELADLVAFVASHQLSFSTGAVFDMSGGRADY